MSKVRISVIVPVYNVEKYLEACLHSIIHQKSDDVEVIIVNDGSTDNSLDIAKKYASNYTRTVLIDKENGGISSARNAGLKAASGNYIGFVDSDDFIVPGMFETLYRIADEHQADLVKCGFFIFNNQTKKLFRQRVEFGTFMKLNSPIERIQNYYTKYINKAVWNGLYRRELFDTIRFKPNTDFEDYYITPELLLECNKYIYTPERLLFYRRRTSGMSLTYRKKTLIDRLNALEANHSLLNKKGHFETIADLYDRNFFREIIFYHKIMMKKYRKSLLGECNIHSLIPVDVFNGVLKRGNLNKSEIIQLKMVMKSHLAYEVYAKSMSIMKKILYNNKTASNPSLIPIKEIDDRKDLMYKTYHQAY